MRLLSRNKDFAFQHFVVMGKYVCILVNLKEETISIEVPENLSNYLMPWGL